MQTVLVELRDKKAFEELHSLQARKLIRILTETGPAYTSCALPGDPMSVEDFRNWVGHAENTPAIDITRAKKQWQAQKKELRKLIR